MLIPAIVRSQNQRLTSMINWLLLFAPFAVGLEHFAPERYLLVF
jgi:hypothetical protein